MAFRRGLQLVKLSMAIGDEGIHIRHIEVGYGVIQCRISLYGRSGTCHGPRALGAPRIWEK